MVSDTPTLGDPSGNLGGITDTFFTDLAQGAGREIGSQIAGWALSSIFHIGGGDQAAIKAKIDVVSGKIDALNAKIDQLSAQMDAAFAAQFTQAERNAYDVAAQLYNADAAKIADYKMRFNSWMKDDIGTVVDGSQSAVLIDMRNNLGYIIQHLNLAMMGTGGGRGLIDIFGSVTFRNLPGFSTGLLKQHEIYTSDYTTPVYDQLDYFKGLAVDAYNMLAEVHHMSWTVGGVTYRSDPEYVVTYGKCLAQFFATWEKKAANTVGRLPNSVVVDNRTGLMWSRQGVVAPRSPIDSMYPWISCWETDCGGGKGYTQQAIKPFVAASTIGGYSDWRLPTKNDFLGMVGGQAGATPAKWLVTNGFNWPRFNSGTVPNYINMRNYFVDEPWAGGGQTANLITDDPRAPASFRVSFRQATYMTGAVAVRTHRAPALGLEEPPTDEPTSTTTTPVVTPIATVVPRFTG